MCGRYYIEIDEKELQDIVDAVEKKTQESGEQLTIKTHGEIFPTDIVPVQIGDNQYQMMKWGFVAYNGKPIINARSETALEKPMFKQAMLERRCLVPASGYYEWLTEGKKKTKHKIFSNNGPVYMAGCYRQEINSPLCHFVILTRQATKDTSKIHDRMPVIITQEYRGLWLRQAPSMIDFADEKLMYIAV